MIISSITLKNFRNYKDSEFVFDPLLNILVGKNGVGKTNVLEACYLMAHGKSWRTRYDFELINFNKNTANLISKVNGDTLFIGLTRTGNRRTKKLFKVNGISRSSNTLATFAKAVIFSPQDLDIIIGSPTYRRNYLDDTLSQINIEYKKKLTSLKKVVRNRNKLLERINEGLSGYSELDYWNKLLIEDSTYVHKKRKDLIVYVNGFLSKEYSPISNSSASVLVKYDHSIASNERLEMYKSAEIGSKRTLVGAHKDDLQINVNKGDVVPKHNDEYDFYDKGDDFSNSRYFASRGEQRTLVFALKLASLSYIQLKIKTGIILLLDDIYSELDEFHRKAISTYFKNNQVIVTTAEKNLVPKSVYNKGRVFELI